jgi:hypothetical protein
LLEDGDERQQMKHGILVGTESETVERPRRMYTLRWERGIANLSTCEWNGRRTTRPSAR